MKTKQNILLLTLLALFVKCDPADVDLQPPTMRVVEYLPTPVEADICGSDEPLVFLLSGGDVLSFDVVFEDDIALSQFKVDIHNNFDCHGHGGGSAPTVSVPDVSNQTDDWSVLDIQNISGTSAPILKTLTVPENVTSGNYHFHIQVIDESGNDSPFANFNALKITNPVDQVPPQIVIEEPATNDFSAQKGDVIRFAGQVTDDRSLSDGGNGVLYLAYTDLSSGNTFNTDFAFPFDQNVGIQYDFDFEYTIPTTLVSGSYRYSLGANDGVRNVAEFAFFNVEIE